MKNYWAAECVATSFQPFTYGQVCEVANACNLIPERMGVIRQNTADGIPIFRMYWVPYLFNDRTEAYAAAGARGKEIARTGPKAKGFGGMCVLEDFASPYPGMESNENW